MTNGHADAVDENLLKPPTQPRRSESELSDTNDFPAAMASPDGANDGMFSDDDAVHDMATSELDEDEDAPGEEDADFDMESPTRTRLHDIDRRRSSSESSSRPGKRKADVDDEEYMKQNPELYGLRRSGRARPTRRVVDSSDEDEDDDEDAVNTGSRRKRQKTAVARPSSIRESSRAATSDVSDSDQDTYGGQRGRTFAKKHRQRLQDVASGSGTPQLGEVRFSSRRAGKVTTYNEDENFDNFEEDDDDNTTPNYWTYAEEDNTPAIDAILTHRVMEGTEKEVLDKHDYEFNIKWQGKAHYHATWHTWRELSDSGYKGIRRLENYFRKIVKVEQQVKNDPDIAAEDKERWNLDREGYLDSLNDYVQVERVIGSRDGEEGIEYFVKWKSLFYDACTWESADLVSSIAQAEIDRFLDRSAKLPVSDKTEQNINTRSAYKPFRAQPSYIKGGELREFQIHGLNFLAHHWCRGNNVILADEMGLGKTVQTVSFINWLRHDRRQQGPFIVVVPLSTMPAWADTFNNWTPDVNYVVYNGNEAARKIIREYELLVDGNPKKVKFNVLLTTYEYILADATFLSQLKWQFMAVDEAHRLKNRESQLYAKLMDFGATSRLLITGTPMQNTLGELSALMDFLMPGKVHVDENIDLMSDDASKKLAELTDAISPYMIRRTKQKVENDLPPKTEKIIRVELSDVQLEYYKNILTRNYAALNAGSKAQKTSLLNIMMELKKASNHPFMFPNAEERILAGSDSREDQLKALITSSGKMMLLDQLLTKMKKDGHRVLIFSQMVKMLDLLGDYLQLRGYQFQRLDGTIAAGPRRMAIDHFNAPESQDFCFLLSTRAGGLGINLMTADTVILFDSDWNPQADLQAMARAHRIGQKKPVTIYRFVSKDTVEEEVLERARNKLMLEFITIQRGVTDKDARDLGDRMQRIGANTVEPTSSDDISQILKKRGQKMFEQSGNQRKLEELDIDAVLENAEEHQTEQPQGMTTDGGEEFLRSFEYTDVKIDLEWDEIIPKAELDKIKEQERKKQEEDYLESVIEQNQPRKRKAAGEDGRDQRAAKKRAREANMQHIDEDGSGPDDNDSDHGLDPKRALGEKECRHLIRAYERYGAMNEKEDEIIKAARLLGRDVNTVRSTLQEIIDTAIRLQQEEVDRQNEIERTTGKPVTKKEKKAVLFDFRGVKRLNAETLTERPEEMRMVRTCVEQCPDWRTFRVPEASKPATYTSDWGAKEDGMLCVGIARHGYGAWVPIRDDAELGLGEKFYLEEHRVGAKEERNKAGDEKTIAKSPGAVHLVRRANYLLSVLKDKISNGTNQAAKKALENHHRNNRKHLGQFHGRMSTPGMSGSPGPNSVRNKQSSDARRLHQSDIRNSLDRRTPLAGSPNGHRPRGSDDRRPGHQRNGSSHTNGGPKLLTETEQKARRILDSVSSTLLKVSGATKKRMPDDDARLKLIKQGLVTIGNHINAQVPQHGREMVNTLWDYVSEHHWPQSKAVEKRVPGNKLRDMYTKIAGKDSAAKASPIKPKPSAASNGTSQHIESKPDIKVEASQPQAAMRAGEQKSESLAAVKNEVAREASNHSPSQQQADPVTKTPVVKEEG
ncbi:Putative chromo/chromo shadow domain, helicase, Helicase superfamily 1/2, ATP-binding protein [Septoria linicola]|uniref:Chromo/chromo shadow domain, helicase, Helicase superfamily 1/2, ATP-binding protein n=1 Tax=Septoria linicola TaxID=215465 RepID=A0A9Q9AK95_9PEZI|nr:putative chromo/chromo shadow domain, helicase, Helicase superfamily 1/2, ATP-binding protein [Septoria linicola]USW47481.1 Putative chromo/chromo shadow domain, helicase, Helicase superfamily 1/2, ATP-binding protein [Septoria linicola]